LQYHRVGDVVSLRVKEGELVGGEQDLWVSQIRKGVVEVVILGLLAREQMYGSQLVEELSTHSELAISAGTVYPLLSRLKKSGVVASVWQESPVGPPRKYYHLTDTGASELAEMSVAWRSVSCAVDSILKGVVE
jgi:PadR family transcriptional regulator PadR